jgi:hypothetical protein
MRSATASIQAWTSIPACLLGPRPARRFALRRSPASPLVVLPYPILWDLSSAHSNHYDSLTTVLEGLKKSKTDWHTLDEGTVDH